ncbi:hypothetical protein [Halolamina sp. C58]|uniref:hypothetical protein n=1 Tax=Halolamina sp. C58 TaxID=3421640 RepID=UPI003EB96B2C
MPSRRSLLASLSVAAGAGLAGCSAGPPGVAATTDGDAYDTPDSDSAPVVARDEAESAADECPKGVVQARSRVHERPTENGREFVLASRYRIVPGENVCADRGWKQAGIAVTHAWETRTERSEIATTGSNVVPTERDGWLTLERESVAGERSWTVHVDRGQGNRGNAVTLFFRSTLSMPAEPADGDLLARTAGSAPVRGGWLGGSATLETRTELVYGRTD